MATTFYISFSVSFLHCTLRKILLFPDCFVSQDVLVKQQHPTQHPTTHTKDLTLLTWYLSTFCRTTVTVAFCHQGERTLCSCRYIFHGRFQGPIFWPESHPRKNLLTQQRIKALASHCGQALWGTRGWGKVKMIFHYSFSLHLIKEDPYYMKLFYPSEIMLSFGAQENEYPVIKIIEIMEYEAIKYTVISIWTSISFVFLF